MNPRRVILVVLLLSPYIFGFRPSTDDSTSVSVGVGGGSYTNVYADCNGETVTRKIGYWDAGAAVDYYTPMLHLGFRGAAMPNEVVRDLYGSHPIDFTAIFDSNGTGSFHKGTAYFATPMVGFSSTYLGIDLGAAFPLGDLEGITTHPFFAGALRVGRADKFHFRLRSSDDVPMMSGAPGLVHGGFAFPLGDPRMRLYIGLGSIPTNGVLIGSQLELPLSGSFLLQLAGAVGGSEEFDYSFSMRTKVVF